MAAGLKRSRARAHIDTQARALVYRHTHARSLARTHVYRHTRKHANACAHSLLTHLTPTLYFVQGHVKVLGWRDVVKKNLNI